MQTTVGARLLLPVLLQHFRTLVGGQKQLEGIQRRVTLLGLCAAFGVPRRPRSIYIYKLSGLLPRRAASFGCYRALFDHVYVRQSFGKAQRKAAGPMSGLGLHKCLAKALAYLAMASCSKCLARPPRAPAPAWHGVGG